MQVPSLAELPFVSEWDYSNGLFEDEVFVLSSQGRQKLSRVGHRKNWRKYTSVRDFLFSEIGGKKWTKSAVDFYRGQGDLLIMQLDAESAASWTKTVLVAVVILNSSLEFKTFSAFRRTVLEKTIKGAK